jgi:hypothetical protein
MAPERFYLPGRIFIYSRYGKLKTLQCLQLIKQIDLGLRNILFDMKCYKTLNSRNKKSLNKGLRNLTSYGRVLVSRLEICMRIHHYLVKGKMLKRKCRRPLPR